MPTPGERSGLRAGVALALMAKAFIIFNKTSTYQNRKAKKVFYLRKKASLNNFRTVERRMGILGFFAWIIIPVVRQRNHTQ